MRRRSAYFTLPADPRPGRGCAAALQHSLPDEALTIVARADFGREFGEPIALPNGRDADLGSAANAFEVRRPLATGPKQRIH
jgi:hypothetical protein